VTLVEFLHPLRGAKQGEIVLATLYYMRRYQDINAATVERIRTALTQARVTGAKKMNIAQALANMGHYVNSPGNEGARRLWEITDTGSAQVRRMMGLPEAEPEIEHDVAALTNLAANVKDDNVREYLDEALKCLQVGALRAAIVFVWTAAIRTLHEDALTKGVNVVNVAIQKQDPKARDIRRVDDFAYVKDRKFLDASPEIGILDKGEKDTLVEALDLRNRCGHPTKYRPRESKAKGFFEDVIGIVFRV
jgi:hypothetical protein